MQSDGGFTLIELLLATVLLSMVILPVLANISVSLERLERRQQNLLIAHSLALACLAQEWTEQENQAVRDTLMADGSRFRIVENRSREDKEQHRLISILIRQEGRWDTLWTVIQRQILANRAALR